MSHYTVCRWCSESSGRPRNTNRWNYSQNCSARVTPTLRGRIKKSSVIGPIGWSAASRSGNRSSCPVCRYSIGRLPITRDGSPIKRLLAADERLSGYHLGNWLTLINSVHYVRGTAGNSVCLINGIDPALQRDSHESRLILNTAEYLHGDLQLSEEFPIFLLSKTTKTTFALNAGATPSYNFNFFVVAGVTGIFETTWPRFLFQLSMNREV